MKKNINEMITAIIFVIGILNFMQLVLTGDSSGNNFYNNFVIFHVLSIAVVVNYGVYLISFFSDEKVMGNSRTYNVIYMLVNFSLFCSFFALVNLIAL